MCGMLEDDWYNLSTERCMFDDTFVDDRSAM